VATAAQVISDVYDVNARMMELKRNRFTELDWVYLADSVQPKDLCLPCLSGSVSLSPILAMPRPQWPQTPVSHGSDDQCIGLGKACDPVSPHDDVHIASRRAGSYHLLHSIDSILNEFG
jgi:hypothetical protein